MPLENLHSQRILLIADPTQEAPAVKTAISRYGHEVVNCENVSQACAEIKFGAATLVVSQKFLNEKSLGVLTKSFSAQPEWSRLPVIVILKPGEKIFTESNAFGALEHYTELNMVESPVLQGPLIRALRMALACRKQQYQCRDLRNELESSRHDVDEANRAKSDFLANISHEIRTPLGAILGFAELLMDPGSSKTERNSYMRAAKRNGEMLSALIDDILDLSRVEAGRIEIAKIDFSLRELVSEVVSALQPLAQKKGLCFSVEQQADLDQIVTDPIRLKQILCNIAGNAIKFTGHGSVTMRIKTSGKVTDRTLLDVEVEDTGIGISSHQATQLFRPFTQADTSTTRRFGGTGLGLVLSQKLARAMGGDLELKWSIPGGGSNFSFSIPVKISESPRAGSKHTVVAAESKLPLAGSNILLVDDSLDNQMLISRILMLLGAKVELANDGVEGVDKALADEYDVVLMDLQMPRLGGVEATRKLRAKGYRRPIVALTAHSMQEDRQKCINVGCSDYLTKPVQRSVLVQVIERLSQANGGASGLSVFGPKHR